MNDKGNMPYLSKGMTGTFCFCIFSCFILVNKSVSLVMFTLNIQRRLDTSMQHSFLYNNEFY